MKRPIMWRTWHQIAAVATLAVGVLALLLAAPAQAAAVTTMVQLLH